jgi:3',5'-cyclic AMP phosphodiesterase CpdA
MKKKSYLSSLLAYGAFFLLFTTTTKGHEGPDPLGHWLGRSDRVTDGKLISRLGPNGSLSFKPTFIKDKEGESLLFEGANAKCLLAEDLKSVINSLPSKALTVSAWVSVSTQREWGGILGVIQDNGAREKGWVLGYNESTFYFGLATEGADDGDGKMTYLKAKTNYELGKLYYLTATYDGNKTDIYVNGNLENSSTVQSGNLLYPDSAPYVLGAYQDADEFYPHHGRIRDVKVFGQAASAEWVSKEFGHYESLANEKWNDSEPAFQVLVEPYLQFATKTSMTVMWQTNQKASSIVHYGTTIACDQKIEGNASGIHEVVIEGLEPETQYFYRVESRSVAGTSYFSESATFKTAVDKETPFAFAVISDTQGNPKVSGELAKLAWGQRPSFLLHPGDLVSTGKNRDHWLKHFFPGMRPLINHIAFFPVLGNHEQNAKHYYNYVSLPKPEYYYAFNYGNARFFMIDTNQKIHPGSVQYSWLEQELANSDATWKFVCHHHPPYSSDENDYGNLWKTNQGKHGDLRARELVPLYEKYGVDVVWNGHIHSYERTWRVSGGQAVESGGPFYMITGGGGGGLETPAPTRPFFQNNVRRGHHYVMVHINGGTLEMKAFTLDDRLFDYHKINK